MPTTKRVWIRNRDKVYDAGIHGKLLNKDKLIDLSWWFWFPKAFDNTAYTTNFID